MSTDLTLSFTVDQSPEEAFAAITDVRAWWSGTIEGPTDRLGAEFSYSVPDIHRSTFRITELEPARRVSWLVLDAWLSFTEDPEEWAGTTVTFDLSEVEGRTFVRFTHVGLSTIALVNVSLNRGASEEPTDPPMCNTAHPSVSTRVSCTSPASSGMNRSRTGWPAADSSSGLAPSGPIPDRPLTSGSPLVSIPPEEEGKGATRCEIPVTRLFVRTVYEIPTRRDPGAQDRDPPRAKRMPTPRRCRLVGIRLGPDSALLPMGSPVSARPLHSVVGRCPRGRTV